MHDRSEHFQATEPPAVGRPRGVAWRSLQAEGILWEGQVYLVGGDADLAARAIVTPRRLVFARGGEVALDVPRVWLRPAPFLRRNGAVVLNISPPGLRYGDPPETLVVRMREGHPAAGHLVAMLAGSGARRIPADLDALAAAVRPALPEQDHRRDDFDARQPAGGRAPESEASRFAASDWAAPSSPPDPLSSATVGAIPAPIWPEDVPDRAPGPPPVTGEPRSVEAPRVALVRQASAPVAPPRTRDWNLPFHQPLQPRSQRRHRWGWAFKLGGLVALLTTAAALGAGRIPSPLDTLGAAPPTPTIGAALIAEVTATMAPLPVAPTAVPPGIGGPSGPVRSAPADAPPLAIAEGSSETWTEPTAAPPAPAVIAPVDGDALDGESAEAPAPATDTEAEEGEPAEAPAPSSRPAADGGGDPAGAPVTERGAQPTVRPAAQPAETPTPAPAKSATSAAVETPAPPATEPAADAAQVEPTPAATATSAPEPTATPQPEPTATPAPTVAPAPTPPAVAAAQTAEPEVAAATAPTIAVRLAAGGATLPAFGLPPTDGGNWIVVVADAANRSTDPLDLAMDDFRLRFGPDGAETALDPGSDLVAAVANIQPAYAPGDVITLTPGEAARLVLVFQIDPSAADLELLAGDDAIDLAPALAAGGDVASLSVDPAAP